MDYLCAMDTVYGEANCKTERRVIMGREEEDEDIGSVSSFSGHDDSVSSINSRGSSSSSSSELAEDASSSNSSLSTVNDDHQFDEGPLFEMCDLMSDLPIKRGLSKFFEGKSQSFTSLSNVRSLEDLVKAERPSNKRIKACKSYAGGLNRHKPLLPKHCAKSGSIMKKSSKLGSFGMKRRSFLGLNRPPIPPTMPRSAGISGQTLLFA